MHIEKQHAKFADTDTDTYVQTVSHFLIKRLEIKNVVWYIKLQVKTCE